MINPRVLIIEDTEDDALLIEETLRARLPDIRTTRVDSADGLAAALDTSQFDLVISDYSMPRFTAEDALGIVRQHAADIPFVIVSGTIADETAVKLMRQGVADYLLKDNLARLGAVVEREVAEAEMRAERRIAEHRLRQVEERLRATVQHAAVGIANVALDGTLLDVNPRFCDIVGYGAEELIGTNVSRLTCADDANASRSLTDAGAAEIRCDKRYVKKSGEIVWVSVSTAAVHDADGRFQHFATVVIDITQQKVTETLLLASEERYRNVVERMQEGICVVDAQERFTMVNQAAAAIIGYTVADLVGHSIYEIMFPEGQPKATELVSEQRLGKPSEGEFVVRHKDGRPILIRFSSGPLFSDSGEYVGLLSVVTDITTQRKAEDELRASKAELERAQRSAHTGSWRMWLRTGEVTWSDETFRLFGAEPASTFPMARFLEFIDPEHLHRVRERNERVIRTGIAESIEYRIRTPGGSTKWLESRAELARDAAGNPDELFGTDQDITERKLYENALEASEERYRQLVTQAHDAIFAIGPNGLVESANRIMELSSGLSAEQLAGRYFIDLIAADDRSRVAAVLATVVGGGSAPRTEIRLPGDGTTPITLEVAFSSTTSPAGDVTILAIGRDVTERNAALAANERLSRDLHLLMQSTTQGIYVVDVDGRCTFINRAGAEAIGHTAEAIVGKDMHTLIHHTRPNGRPYPAEECAILSTMNGGAGINGVEDIVWRKDGTWFVAEYGASPVVDAGQVVGCVVAFTDVSERKLLQRQLEQVERLSSLGRLAATIAHEFNNVLMGIQPFAEVLSRSASEPAAERATQHILQAVQRGRRVTQEILRFTRPSEPARRVFDLREWLQASMAMIGAYFSDNVTFRMEGIEASARVNADPDQLEQIMTNLAANARDAMPNGGDFTIRVERTAAGQTFPFGILPTSEPHVHLIASDTGIGMTPQTLKHIFDPFFTTKRSGTGLGLAIVHQMLRLQGGSIFAESTEGVGTAFHIFLPVAAEPAIPAGEAPGDVTRVSANAGLPDSVLLVEDDDVIAAGMSQLLEMEGVRTIVARTGHEALQRIADTTSQVVILDLNLPDMAGVEVYKRALALRPGLAVIFASGAADAAAIDAFAGRRGVASLMKPYDFDTLLQTLLRVTAK